MARRTTSASWDDANKALQTYLDQKDDLYARRTPRTKAGGLVMSELYGRYMTAKDRSHAAGEITQRTWMEYFATCQRRADLFGQDRLVINLGADDFERLRAAIMVRRNLRKRDHSRDDEDLGGARHQAAVA